MKKFILYFMIFVMLFSSGCIEKNQSITVDNTKINKYIVYNLGKLPEDLILLNDSKIREKDLLLALFEGLVRVDEDGEIVPGIAESWDISEDAITYTFHLRNNAKWSDGTSITAQDFVNFFKQILNSKQENIFAYQLYYIFGAKDYRENKKNFDGAAIRAVNEKTLEFRMNSPVTYFLEILSQPIYTLRKIDNNLKTWRNSYEDIVFSGPFTVDYISSSGEVSLLINDFYYEKNKVRSERFFITSIIESETALAEFINQEINMFINPPLIESQSLIVDGNAEVIPVDSGVSINFNLKKAGIVNDLNFRKALNSAINRKNLIKDDLHYIARSASAYVPYNEEDNNQNIKDKHLLQEDEDVSLAQELLKKSNYNEKEKLMLVYLANNENRKFCSTLIEIMEETLDINLESKGYNEVELKEILKNGEYDMLVMNYASLYDDALSLLESWTSESALNLFGYKNNQYDNLINQAKYEKNKNKRIELLREAEKKLIEDMPVIPVYFHNILLCKTPNIKGVYTTKEGNVKFDRAVIRK